MGLTVSCEVLKFEVLYIYIYIYENTEYFNTHTGREDKVLKKQILVYYIYIYENTEYFNTHTGREDKVLKKQILVYFQKELTIRNYYWLICVAF